MTLGDQEFTLLRARWFSAAACHIDLTTETPRLRTYLAWDEQTEKIVEAKAIANQVVLVKLPHEPNQLTVLDRQFDTLLIPGGEED